MRSFRPDDGGELPAELKLIPVAGKPNPDAAVKHLELVGLERRDAAAATRISEFRKSPIDGSLIGHATNSQLYAGDL
jgi:hypothetical protein